MGRIQAFWGLSAEPFVPHVSPFVGTPVHDEAVSRILHAVDSGDSRICFTASEGLGKTAVLRHVAERLRSPQTRLVRVHGGSDLLSSIFEAIRSGPRSPDSAHATWQRMVEAVRVLRMQRIRLIVMVDECDHMIESDRRNLSRLLHIDPHREARICLVEAGRDTQSPDKDPWSLAIRLRPLTRSESVRYLVEKLSAVGRSGEVFTEKAYTRLYSLSGGVPRGLDRLAYLAMIAGAASGREILPPEVIDGVSGECNGPIVA